MMGDGGEVVAPTCTGVRNLVAETAVPVRTGDQGVIQLSVVAMALMWPSWFVNVYDAACVAVQGVSLGM
jgi:hypothetical protein